MTLHQRSVRARLKHECRRARPISYPFAGPECDATGVGLSSFRLLDVGLPASMRWFDLRRPVANRRRATRAIVPPVAFTVLVGFLFFCNGT